MFLQVNAYYIKWLIFSFTLKSYLDCHRWTHSTEKDLECHYCNITFTSKNKFSQHLRENHSKNKYDCRECERKFKSDASLIRHVDRVHRKKPRQISANPEQVENMKNNKYQGHSCIRNPDGYVCPLDCVESQLT